MNDSDNDVKLSSSAQSLEGESEKILVDTTDLIDDAVSEEEEVLIEPRFKYGRILGDLSKVLETDGASCVAIHDKYIAIGCRSGRICIFDHLGNAHMESTGRRHKCAVSCISIDLTGGYIASCANDYTVSLFGIGCEEYNQKITIRVSARAIAIAGNFSSPGSGHKFVIGERDLILYERNFLRRQKSTVLYSGQEKDGFVTAISLRDSYIAFTNESGTRIYDCSTSRTITLIQPLHKIEMYYSSKFQPRHVWLNSSTLAIGWANTVCICEILVRKLSEKSVLKYGQIIHRWIIPDFYISGISFTSMSQDDVENNQLRNKDEQNCYNENNRVENSNIKNPDPSSLVNGCQKAKVGAEVGWCEIVLFGIRVTNSDVMNNASNFDENKSFLSDGSTTTAMTTAMLNLNENQQSSAQLILIQPVNMDQYQLTAEETIEMRHAEPRNLSRFSLAALPHDSLYFLLGPRELIEAHPCSIDNRIAWLIENDLYYEAVACALKHRDNLQETSVVEVGRHLITHLMSNSEYETAAKFLPQICSGQKEEWEYYVGEFEKARQILKIVPVVPVRDPQLEPECYESILTVALYTMPSFFLALILQWSTDLYRVGSIRDKTISRMAEKGILAFGFTSSSSSSISNSLTSTLSKEDVISLYKVLAHLYVYERDFRRALEIYLLLRDPVIFGVIERYNLFSSIQERIVELMEVNTDLTIRLLLDNENSLPSNNVVTSLSNHPKLQIAYLNKLFNRGEGSEYSDLMVRLYAEHDRPKLLSFLRKSEHYRLDKAIDVCRRRNLVEEKIFLLGRSGNRTEALEEIINNLNRIEMAIDFCKEHGETDVELWDRLIELAMKNPMHITALLSAVGTLIDDPLRVIERIPPDMPINGLSDSLIRIFDDIDAQYHILQEALNISKRDASNLFVKYTTPFSATVNFVKDICTICGSYLNDESSTNSLVDSANDNSDIKIFFCNHIFHSRCLDNRTRNGLPDACPLCFEMEEENTRQTESMTELLNAPLSALKSGQLVSKRRRATTIATMGSEELMQPADSNSIVKSDLNPFYE